MAWAVMALTVMTAIAVRDASAQGVTWGFKGGVVRASVSASGEGAYETKARPGGALGGFVAWSLNRAIRIQPEVLYTVQQFELVGLTPRVRVAAKGMAMPFLVHAGTSPDRRARATVFGGPQLTVIGSVSQQIGPIEADISDRIANLDIGVALGAGLEVDAGRGAFVVDVRGTIGGHDLSETGSPSLRSRALSVLIGYSVSSRR